MKNIRAAGALMAMIIGIIVIIAGQSGDLQILSMLFLILWAIDEKKGE